MFFLIHVFITHLSVLNKSPLVLDWSIMFMLSLDGWPGVFLRWDDDRGPSVGVSPPLGQNSEQTSAAGKKTSAHFKDFWSWEENFAFVPCKQSFTRLDQTFLLFYVTHVTHLWFLSNIPASFRSKSDPPPKFHLYFPPKRVKYLKLQKKYWMLPQ